MCYRYFDFKSNLFDLKILFERHLTAILRVV